MEEVYQASGLEWTLLRPTWMGAGESEAYRVALGALPQGCKAMHFRGLAKFMLDAAAEGSQPPGAAGYRTLSGQRSISARPMSMNCQSARSGPFFPALVPRCVILPRIGGRFRYAA